MNYMTKNITRSALLLAIIFFYANLGIAQNAIDKEWPQKVNESFNNTFPAASDLKWELKGELYQIEFDNNRSKGHFVLMDKSGNIVKHEEEIPKADLPEVVIRNINTKYTTYNIDSVKKITENDLVSYLISLESSNGELEVHYTQSGDELEN